MDCERASEYAVDLGGHDEVVLMQPLDLLGLERDRRIAPTEADVWMMAFSFREFTNFQDKGKRLSELVLTTDRVCPRSARHRQHEGA